MKHSPDDFHHPYDTIVSGGLRFLSELIAWVAGPWALSLLSGWLVLPSLVFLVGLPSVFSTLNDKHKVVISTPGPVRVGLELFLYLVAAVAPWFIWSPAVSGIAVGIVIAALVTGFPRIMWLIRGAPRKGEDAA